MDAPKGGLTGIRKKDSSRLKINNSDYYHKRIIPTSTGTHFVHDDVDNGKPVPQPMYMNNDQPLAGESAHRRVQGVYQRLTGRTQGPTLNLPT